MRALIGGFAVLALVAGFGEATPAAIIDLGHPTLPPVYSSNSSSDPLYDFSIAFDALTTFSIDSAGLVIDPRGNRQLEVKIRQVDTSSGGIGTRGSVLASGVASMSDIGMAFYDAPVSFTFAAGNRYDIAFNSPITGWNPGTPFEAYLFDPTRSGYAAYSVAGLVSVVDGGSNFGLGSQGGYRNTGMLHIRFNTVAAIPEPSSVVTWITLSLCGLFFTWRRRKRAA